MTRRRGLSSVVGATGLILAVIVLAGCALVPSPWVGRWDLVSVGAVPASGDASVVFTASSIVLATGCNSGAGSYTYAGGHLSLDGVAFTARTCPGVLAVQDAAFRELASGTSTMNVSGATMTVAPADGAPVLTFSKAGGA